MNRILQILLPCLFCFSGLSAQTIITVNSAYVIGDNLSAQLTDTSAHQGLAGAGQAWDFSGLTKKGPLSVFQVKSVALTGYQSEFPTASMAIEYGGDNFSFLVTTDSTMEITGEVIDGKPFIYDDNEIIFKYPFTYTSAYTDTFRGKYQKDDVTVNRTGIATFYCDANGTLILPTGVVSSTLRIKFVETISDEAKYGNISVTTVTTITSYFWMVASNKNSLMKIIYTSQTANGITTESEEDYYYLPFVSTEDIGLKATDLIFFPNPTSGNAIVTFCLTEESNLDIHVENLLGQQVIGLENERFLKGTCRKEIDFSRLPPGTYLLKIKDDNGVYSVLKFRKE